MKGKACIEFVSQEICVYASYNASFNFKFDYEKRQPLLTTLNELLYCCIGGLSTFRGSFQVRLYMVTFIVSCARQLWCDISAHAGLLCEEAAMVNGHSVCVFVCV